MPRLGVLGTMVWDTIYARDVGREAPVEEWGGIAYALSAFDAAAEGGWTLFPIVKVGSDLRRRADGFLNSLRTLESLDGVRTVPEPNNRVELRYRDRERRCEKLRGGVPGWSWEELAPLARSCDALYVNFIAGWEMDLQCAGRLRATYEGPLYCDIHSLLLGVGPDGVRVLRPPAEWRDWVACFDIVQLNEDELAALAKGWGDPWKLAADVVGPATGALLVTLGSRGSAWVATTEFLRQSRAGTGVSRGAAGAGDGVVRPGASGRGLEGSGTVVTGLVENRRTVKEPDPTGCGDVWGITCFASLLAGWDLESAMGRANDFAARNAAYHGAAGLAKVLRSASGIVLEEEH